MRRMPENFCQVNSIFYLFLSKERFIKDALKTDTGKMKSEDVFYEKTLKILRREN